eukprot:19641-Eustigmatos_ZCMA.PRE.1
MTPSGMIGVIFQVYTPDDDLDGCDDDDDGGRPPHGKNAPQHGQASAPAGNTVEVRRGKVGCRAV